MYWRDWNALKEQQQAQPVLVVIGWSGMRISVVLVSNQQHTQDEETMLTFRLEAAMTACQFEHVDLQSQLQSPTHEWHAPDHIVAFEH